MTARGAAVETVTATGRTRLSDPPVSVKGKLCGLWVAMLMVFAYVDIFGFWRADVVRGALAGEVPGTGLTIGQGFLLFSLGYVLVPVAMVVVSLLAPAPINRVLNLGVGALVAVSVVAFTIGEGWAYYVVGSVVEVALMVAVVRIAWHWPREADPS